jgi:AraC-like DNA-binding protein
MDYTQEITNFSADNMSGLDLIVYQCGIENCKPLHSFGPAVRDHFLIHYILEGSGTFYVDGISYKLSKNQGFLILPDIITYYEADAENPWIYAWVGFSGIKAENYLNGTNLSKDNPIFEYTQGDFIKECFEDMIKAIKMQYGRDLRLKGLLSLFLSELIECSGKSTTEGTNQKEAYLKKTFQYIESNYSRNISISEIAQNINLNKNYFSNFFKDNIGLSPQEYLINYRINKACELMKNPLLSISDIARSVGYNDALGFSKIFKKLKGQSPKKYREIYVLTKG